tara:strand:- start:10115 stop:10633 length:519 start_codon:yes stop_codon:yes gene_type:complete
MRMHRRLHARQEAAATQAAIELERRLEKKRRLRTDRIVATAVFAVVLTVFAAFLPLDVETADGEWTVTETTEVEVLPIVSGTQPVRVTDADGVTEVTAVDLAGLTHLTDPELTTSVVEEQECREIEYGRTLLAGIFHFNETATTPAHLYAVSFPCGTRTVIITAEPLEFASR